MNFPFQTGSFLLRRKCLCLRRHPSATAGTERRKVKLVKRKKRLRASREEERAI